MSEDVFSIPLANGQTYTWSRRYEVARPSGKGLEITQGIREISPVQGRDGRWCACWEPDGPPRYWYNGQELTGVEWERLATEAAHAD